MVPKVGLFRQSNNFHETITYVQYLGRNNLYEWATIQKLPKHDFAWKDKANEKTDQVMKKKKEGYVLLEVGVWQGVA